MKIDLLWLFSTRESYSLSSCCWTNVKHKIYLSCCCMLLLYLSEKDVRIIEVIYQYYCIKECKRCPLAVQSSGVSICGGVATVLSSTTGQLRLWHLSVILQMSKTHGCPFRGFYYKPLTRLSKI